VNMPRYFFHLNNTIVDEEGEEFDLVEAARGHAIAVARELSRNGLSDGLAGHHISVVDERGVVVFKVLLRVAIVFAVVLRAGVHC
jgi:hypothetical protein